MARACEVSCCVERFAHRVLFAILVARHFNQLFIGKGELETETTGRIGRGGGKYDGRGRGGGGDGGGSSGGLHASENKQSDDNE